MYEPQHRVWRPFKICGAAGLALNRAASRQWENACTDEFKQLGMETKEGKKVDDAPECLKGTEQSFPGAEAGIPGITATWPMGG